MSDSIARIKVTKEWLNLNASSGIAAGTATKCQRIGGDSVDIAISTAEPVGNIGERLQSGDNWFAVEAGESAVWARCTGGTENSSATMSFQENA